MPIHKKLLILIKLARASNIPTVWSNVIAAYFLSGSNNYRELTLSLIGSSFLYASGMYLNDWFDADFDSKNAKHRPLPMGEIKQVTVLIYSILGFFIGITCLTMAALSATPWVLLLVTLIIWYNADHKENLMSPFIMASCRFTLYPMVSLACTTQVTPIVLLAGFSMFLYTLGISFTARTSGHSKVAMSLFIVAGVIPVLAYSLLETKLLILTLPLFIAWLFYTLKTMFLKSVDIDKTVSQLIAGMVFVDLFFIFDYQNLILTTTLFLALFAGTRVAQKFIPAN